MTRLQVTTAIALLCIGTLGACSKGGGFSSPENEERFEHLPGFVNDLKADMEAGKDGLTISCGGVMALAEPLLGEENEEAKALAEEAAELCGLTVPIHDSGLYLVEARAALEAGETPTLPCSSAGHALDNAHEDYAENEDLVARRHEVALVCDMESHLGRIESFIAEGRAELETDPTTLVLMACSSSDGYFDNIEGELANHERVAEVRQNVLRLCGRDFPLTKISAQLDAAEAWAAANPDGRMNMECSGARVTSTKFDESFASDPEVVAVLARHQQLCAR